jgi:thiol-disulfide isomerase/thioredoxin
MLPRRHTVLICSALIAAIGCGERASSAGGATPGATAKALKPPAIGAPAPTLALTDLDARPVSLAAMRDTVVVLNVWATWCQPCRMETPELVAMSTTFANAPVRFVGVSVDSYGAEPEIRDFLKEFNVPYAIWLDPQKDVQAQFLTIGVPETFVIDKQGVIRARQIGGFRAGDSTLVTAIRAALAP